MAEGKLKKLLEYNVRLKEELTLERTSVSEASKSLVQYCRGTKDYLIPSIWGSHFDKKDDPFAPQSKLFPCL